MTIEADRTRVGNPIVQLRAVSKVYGDVLAVDAVDLELRRGEFFSLLGPSGCGKTTTLRLIGGFEVPNSGDILIGGRDVARIPPHKRPVNTVFQSYALFQHLNVFNNIGFGLKERRLPKKEIAIHVTKSLELVSLSGAEQRMPRQLSGGQQQRVALARALVNEPEVLLLDEPLGALDLKLRKEMQGELKHMQERLGITFLYVTHDQEEAFTMSDRVGVMNKGQLVQVGAPEELYDRPRDRYVAGFVGESNILPGTVVSLDGDIAVVDAGTGEFVQAVLDKATPVQTGQAAYVVVRPERMELEVGHSAEHSLGAQWSSIHGLLQETIFSGSRRTLIVEIAGGRRLSVSLPNRREVAKSVEVGCEVRVSWLAVDAWIMAD
jgi:spermidine/putrescine transport system ATP-binding protein